MGSLGLIMHDTSRIDMSEMTSGKRERRCFNGGQYRCSPFKSGLSLGQEHVSIVFWRVRISSCDLGVVKNIKHVSSRSWRDARSSVKTCIVGDQLIW